MTFRIFSHTQGLCGVCRERVPARTVERDGSIWLEKMCPRHGRTSVLTSTDPAWTAASLSYVKPRQRPRAVQVAEFKGCPDSCGMCPEHRQHTCLPVIEIDQACDLDCPVCLKGGQDLPRMDLDAFRGVLETLLEAEGSLPVVNLSGGEPTLHPLLPDFLRVCREMGVVQTTVSTNGLRLARDARLRQVFRESGALVALQFDGLDPSADVVLRGRPLVEHRTELLSLLESEGIPYSLVATVARGVNDHEIPRLVDLLFSSKALSLMLQPACFTGNAAGWDESRRLTIPDVVRRLEESRHVSPGDFNPLPCSHHSCFALSYYLEAEAGAYRSLKAFLGEREYLELIANRTLPGLDSEGLALLKGRLYELWSAADTSDLDRRVMDRIRDILRRLPSIAGDPRALLDLGKDSMKAVFVHDFMDARTMDLTRLQKCCNPYARADGRLVPMCAQNVFFAS
ncbi:MAG: radical SAM protein [Fibrobacteria bacterium]|nr:radical SAM protein [Fibrobacteria bacterium]